MARTQYAVSWDFTITANTPEEAAELAVSLMIDQADNMIQIKVDDETFDIEHGKIQDFKEELDLTNDEN